jgi:hypothetical protein
MWARAEEALGLEQALAVVVEVLESRNDAPVELKSSS